VYFPDGIPLPQATIDDQSFWDGCKRHELLAPRCVACGRVRLPPLPMCPDCLSEEFNWVQLPNTGVVYTFTFVHHIVEPGLLEMDPYNIAVIEIDGGDHLRIISNVVDTDEENMAIGMPVSVVWDSRGEIVVPRFGVRPNL
jgi:uncharacterized OB-fold protein